MVKRLLSAVLMLMMVLPLLAQSPNGRGVITALASIGASGETVCSGLPCFPVREWLYPTLFAIDPVTGFIEPSSDTNFGLAENVLLTGEATQQIHLRDDLVWGDGQPVTAYDVLFSLLAYQDGISSEITAVTIEDAYTLTLEVAEPDCALSAQINLQVLPAHAFGLDFAANVDKSKAENAAPHSFAEWADAQVLRYRYGYNITETQIHSATAGTFVWEDARPNEPYRLVSGETAIIIRNLDAIAPRVGGSLASNIGGVEAFLEGEITYIINPPVNRRADLLAQPDFQIAVEPSERWAMLMFNFANPDKPRDAFDAEGNPREQGVNPTVGDPAVRQAIKLGIDVGEIIEVVYQGYAEPLASLWPPTSWAHDASRPVTEYDFRAAQDILQAAGWRDSDGDGIRECRECATAPIGTSLTVEMLTDDSLGRVGEMIARQLYRIGINVEFMSDSPSAQRFDMYLAAQTTPWVSDPDVSHWFMRDFDQRNIGGIAPNYGSYYDQNLEELFTAARTVDLCEASTRRDLYGQIQDELDAQTAVIPLFVEQDMIVAQPSALGFDPLPGRPLWNIRDWVVMP